MFWPQMSLTSFNIWCATSTNFAFSDGFRPSWSTADSSNDESSPANLVNGKWNGMEYNKNQSESIRY